MKNTDLFRAAAEYRRACEELRRTEAERDASLGRLDSEVRGKFAALAENIKSFCSSDVLLKVIKNFCYLYEGKIAICGTALAYMGRVPAPLPFTHGDCAAVANGCVARIKEAVARLAKRMGDVSEGLKSLCVSYSTLRAIYDAIPALTEREYSEGARRIDAELASIRDRIAAMERECPMLRDSDALNAALSEMRGARDAELHRFDFSEIGLSEDHSSPIRLPIARRSSTDEGESGVRYWDTDGGIFTLDLPDGDTRSAVPIIKAAILQFLYAYPDADKRVAYYAREASSEMDVFLSRIGNETSGLGDAIFLDGVRRLGAKSFKSDVAERMERLREITRHRLELCDGVADDIYAYNKANPENIQEPMLVVLQGYPNGYDECCDLDYLFREGGRLGICYFVIKTPRIKEGYSYLGSEPPETEEYSAVTASLSRGGFTVEGEGHIPVSVSDGRIASLVGELSGLFKRARRQDIDYEQLGFGEYTPVTEGVVENITIPIGRLGNTTYSINFGCGGSSTIAYLLVGAPGTGKSSLIDAMIINGAMAYSPDDLTFYLLDFKDGVSSAAYVGENAIPHVRMIAENNKPEDAAIIIGDLERQMTERNTIFKACGASNIADYNARGEGRMPRIIVVIDECQVLFANHELSEKCKNLARMGRSAGIHLLLASQAVDTEMMKAGAFIDGRFCFEVAPEIAERVIDRKYASRVRTEVKKGSGYTFASRNSGDTCDRVRIAWHGKRINEYNAKIRERWLPRGYEIELTVAGERGPLYITDACSERNVLASEKPFALPFGENYFDHKPEGFELTVNGKTDARGERTSVLVLGEREEISTDVATSVMIGALRAGSRIRLIDESDECMLHKTFGGYSLVDSRTGEEYLSVLDEVCRELDNRLKNRREQHAPYLLLIHSLHNIDAFSTNALLKTGGEAQSAPVERERRRLDLHRIHEESKKKKPEGEAKEIYGRRSLIEVLKKLHRVPNMYIVITSSVDTEFGDHAEREAIKSMDCKILQDGVSEGVHRLMNDGFRSKLVEGLNENMVLAGIGKQYSKLRFYKYDHDDPRTEELIRSAVRGGGNS